MKTIKLRTTVLALALSVSHAQLSHGTFADWQNQVRNVGATPAATNFTTVNGAAPMVIDVGALSGDSSFEFIVNAGFTGLSSALLGNRTDNGRQGLKFEQWMDSGVLGITNFGVVDILSNDTPPANIDTHIAFVSDGLSTTDLYVNGANVETFNAPLVMFGSQGLAGVIQNNGGPFDLLDGNILGFASYDVALSPAEVATHSNAFFVPEPSTFAILGLAGLSLFGRRRERR
jgi:hypothetical protein